MTRTSPEFREFRASVIDAAIRTGKANRGKNANELSLLVYGVSAYQDALSLWLSDQCKDQTLTVIREIGNSYSASAIAVISTVGKIGYLPDAVARVLASYLDDGRLQIQTIYEDPTEFERDGQTLIGMRIEIRLEPWSDDLIDESLQEN